MNQSILRGDLFYASLNPVVGSEQGGVRPVLIIQNDIGNKHSPTVIVAAITSRAMKATLPTHHILSERSGLEHDSIVLLEQIRTIDKRRLQDYLGALGGEDMRGVDRALGISVGIREGV
jgi:mRNA interferase MazF